MKTKHVNQKTTWRCSQKNQAIMKFQARRGLICTVINFLYFLLNLSFICQ
jgi:hypothetical protein